MSNISFKATIDFKVEIYEGVLLKCRCVDYSKENGIEEMKECDVRASFIMSYQNIIIPICREHTKLRRGDSPLANYY